ncbi:MAG: sulfatase [Chthoniobacteraceae bacterium]|nr:sulfatase [Chthoniobacteraceae bacterium]
MYRLLLLASLSLVCSAALAADHKPNVLFIAVDDLKPLLGCYGDRTIKSPNFDRLAARGVVFNRAYCNQAVCAPSRNALMTGRRPTSLGIYDLGTNFRKAAPQTITLTQHFMANGYRAEGIGKIFHIGHGNDDDPASWSVPLFREKTVSYALPENRKTMTREEALFANKTVTKEMAHGAPVEAADVPDDGYPDGRIATEAVRRLHAAKPDEPFFMAVGFLKPHMPFCAPKKYWDLYDRAAFSLPERRTPPDGAPAFAPTNWSEVRQYSDIPETGPLDDETARMLIHGYHAAVSYVDAQLGRVLDALDASGLAEKTIIVLWGDHGWHLGDHGMWSKHTNYEEAARIPVIVAGPGILKGKSAALIETVDIYPTLAELADLPAPSAAVEGRSFVPALHDLTQGAKDYILHTFPRGERIGRALRTTQYRLVEWKVPGAPAERAEIELYDYENDPLETKNLANDRPEVVVKLRGILSSQFPEAKPQIASEKEKADRAALFARRDKDQDGQLTREEFLTDQPAPDPKRFDKFDTDKNGTLSRDEFIYSGAIPSTAP